MIIAAKWEVRPLKLATTVAILTTAWWLYGWGASILVALAVLYVGDRDGG